MVGSGSGSGVRSPGFEFLPNHVRAKSHFTSFLFPLNLFLHRYPGDNNGIFPVRLFK